MESPPGSCPGTQGKASPACSEGPQWAPYTPPAPSCFSPRQAGRLTPGQGAGRFATAPQAWVPWMPPSASNQVLSSDHRMISALWLVPASV